MAGGGLLGYMLGGNRGYVCLSTLFQSVLFIYFINSLDIFNYEIPVNMFFSSPQGLRIWQSP